LEQQVKLVRELELKQQVELVQELELAPLELAELPPVQRR
jgi:hypothetical protein